ncbi:hypothetical protein GGR57DRAFT_327155 [Xylariaceae sp. FL1272]|nr:hypothetical protein GGR57DRAFT_327155 [Xylariaceae sp. FL1272]
MENMDEKREKPASQRRRRGQAPPRTFREHFFHSLPEYSGPYSVGTMEMEIPAREPRTFSHIKRNHEHILRMDTVLLQIYYPCDLSSYSFLSGSKKKPSRPTWLPRPRVATCHGFAKFLNLPHLPVTSYLAVTSMFTKLPAFRNAKLARSHLDQSMQAAEGAPITATGSAAGSQETLTPDQTASTPFPVVIFSHGLGGSRTYCSGVCGEMASNGFVVVAVEHRDGSGARSFVNLPPRGDTPEAHDTAVIDESRSYTVDYIFPEDNAQDTSPNNAQGVDTELRNAQIEMRLAEIEEAYHVLGLVNDGRAQLVYDANLRKRGGVGSSSRGLEDIDWSDWRGRLFLSQVTAMGHSFGAATTVQLSRETRRFPWVGQGILLDAWGPATPVLGEATEEALRRPILAINSEAFMHWPDNFKRMTAICTEARSNDAPCWMMTIKGATHLSQTDFAILYPRWMSFLCKTLVDPRRAVQLTVNSSLEFLKKILPSEQTHGASSWPDEDILQTKTLIAKEVPAGYKPSEKWIGARLRIPHEFRLRVMRFFRRPSTSAPTDVEGKPLRGVVDFARGEEVWMHCSPDHQEDLDRSEMVQSTTMG